MRITCPSCDASYDLPAAPAGGRVVQCARCTTQWVPVGVAPQETPLTAPPAHWPLDGPMRGLPPIDPQPRPPVVVVAWIASLALLGALAAAALVYRTPIMQAWPPSQRAYAAIGLA